MDDGKQMEIEQIMNKINEMKVQGKKSELLEFLARLKKLVETFT